MEGKSGIRIMGNHICNKAPDWWKARVASGLWILVIICNKTPDWWKAGVAS